MKAAALIHKFRRNTLDYGWKTALRKALARVLLPWYEHRTYRIYRIGTHRESWSRPLAHSHVRFDLVHEDDKAVIAQIERECEWLRGQVRSRLRAGHVCVVAMDGDQVAGFNLIAFGHVLIPALRAHHVFREGTAWSDHIAVNRHYRQQGMASGLRQRVFEELGKRGCKTLLVVPRPRPVVRCDIELAVAFETGDDAVVCLAVGICCRDDERALRRRLVVAQQ